MIPQLQAILSGIVFGEQDSVKGKLVPILSNAELFGSDLYKTGLGEIIEEMFIEEIQGPGAVRKTLENYL